MNPLMMAMMVHSSGITKALTITVGKDSGGPNYGYDDGSRDEVYGSIDDDQFIGETVAVIVDQNAGAGRGVYVEIVGNSVAQDHFTSITIVGSDWNSTYQTADADGYDVSKGANTGWNWDLAPHSAFTESEEYVVTFVKE